MIFLSFPYKIPSIKESCNFEFMLAKYTHVNKKVVKKYI